MNGETPTFSFGKQRTTDEYSSDSSFYSLLMKYSQNTNESSPKNKPKRHYSTFSKLCKNKKALSPAKKRPKSNYSLPKGKFAMFLVKRFKLRNDFDKQHADEFLLSKEQAFEFPHRDIDLID